MYISTPNRKNIFRKYLKKVKFRISFKIYYQLFRDRISLRSLKKCHLTDFLINRL